MKRHQNIDVCLSYLELSPPLKQPSTIVFSSIPQSQSIALLLLFPLI